MWPYPWGCYPSAERPLTPTLWNHQGQCGEQVQGHYPGYPTMPQVPPQGSQNPSTIVEENNPTPFPPTPPTTPTGHFSKASPLFNLPPGRELQSPDLVTLMGQPPTGACHPGSDPPMIRPPVPPTSIANIDFKALEDRLEASLTQKLEIIAKDLKTSWKSTTRTLQVDPSNVVSTSTSARLLPGTTEDSTNTVDDQHQPAANTGGNAYCLSTLPVKAKPPLPPQSIQSTLHQQDGLRHGDLPSQRTTLPRRRTTPGSRESKKRHRSRRSRSPSHRSSRGKSSKQNPDNRHAQPASSSTREPPLTVYRTSSSSTIIYNTRNFDHPIYSRTTMMRRRSPLPRSTRRRSRSPRQQHRQSTTPGLFERVPGLHIQAKARPTRTKSRSGTPQPEPEPPQHTDQPFEMQIPDYTDIPLTDWSQLSPEHRDQDPDDEADDEPILQNDSIWQDRQTMVRTAYEDPGRTRAICELGPDDMTRLTQKVRTRKFNTFLNILQKRNYGTPRMILGNMASIFAQSGRMTSKQAKKSYTFKVSDTCGYGLFVPTLFGQKPGFQDDTTYKYYIIHGTTNTGASRTLAENLLRPGDFSILQDHLLQSDFPTYGHCSIGQPAEDTTLAPLNARQLTKKILKTSQGPMAALVCGTYTGRYPHQKFRLDHPDEAQVLCGKFGIAKGPYNTLVARSEHTTINAVILTYQHHRDVPLPDDRSTSLASDRSSSYLS